MSKGNLTIKKTTTGLLGAISFMLLLAGCNFDPLAESGLGIKLFYGTKYLISTINTYTKQNTPVIAITAMNVNKIAVDSKNKKFYYHDGNTIRRCNQDGTESETFYNLGTSVLAMVVAPNANLLYAATGSTKIYKIDINTKQSIYDATLEVAANCLAWDEKNKALYWGSGTQLYKNGISIYNGSGTVLTINIDTLSLGTIYWAESGTPVKVYSAYISSSGTSIYPKLLTSLTSPEGSKIAIDPYKKMVYWVELSGSEKIYTKELSTTLFSTLLYEEPNNIGNLELDLWP